jgi:hypothetical protein
VLRLERQTGVTRNARLTEQRVGEHDGRTGIRGSAGNPSPHLSDRLLKTLAGGAGRTGRAGEPGLRPAWCVNAAANVRPDYEPQDGRDDRNRDAVR